MEDIGDVLTQALETALMQVEDDEFELIVEKERKRRYSEKKMQAENGSNQQERNSNKSNKRYEDQVVGKRCWIKFRVSSSKEGVGGRGSSSSSLESFFPGTIKAYNLFEELEHLIGFDDGEIHCFDLVQVEETHGRLLWQDPHNNAETATAATAPAAAAKSRKRRHPPASAN